MLQDAKTIRYYQRITDAFVDYWDKGYRSDELRLYLEGYIASLRHADAIEPYLINQVEQEAISYLYDISNFVRPQAEPEPDYY
ncbi:hypothetical protein IQ241_07735 [Romeria aff. gracilis LEGE 07310]|uniref:Uncharacterized protein n=1 Tax=Vasconcelosia minhoensis LEGE 07310 TaxID=915328 RepID=A0A8J7AAH8_9CYAN|nr:DUF6761 family protein [Romeria gracilis]MBE9077186.1 hypothetical protein [Romeria aff. gracilis LEGE 07310]